VDAIRRSRPKSRPLFVSRSSSAPLDDAVLAALVNKRVGRSVSDLAWELGEAPVDVEDAILRLEETGKVEKDRRKLWRAR
jgi:predicted transcriptional regulator